MGLIFAKAAALRIIIRTDGSSPWAALTSHTALTLHASSLLPLLSTSSLPRSRTQAHRGPPHPVAVGSCTLRWYTLFLLSHALSPSYSAFSSFQCIKYSFVPHEDAKMQEACLLLSEELIVIQLDLFYRQLDVSGNCLLKVFTSFAFHSQSKSMH